MKTVMAALVALAPAAQACPFCSATGKRLVDKVAEAQFVVCGRLSNSKLNANPKQDEPLGTTDMKVLKVVKKHPKAPTSGTAKVPVYLPAAEKEPGDFLVFADVRDGEVVPHNAVPLQDNLVAYLEATLKLENAAPEQRLQHFFKYLDDPDEELSRDAYLEFAMASFKDVATAAKHYDVDKVLKWLRDKNTPAYRLGLYGLMVGLGGRTADAPALKAILDDPEQRPLTGADGLIAGYCLLSPKAGQEFVAGLACDPKLDFNYRYAALRAARFLIEENKADKPWLLGKLATQVADRELGDLAIDELRKFKHWDGAAAVFAIESDPKLKANSMLRRAAIRYALRCPGKPAEEFLAGFAARKESHRVENERDALKYEEEVALPAPAEAKAKQ